MGVYEYKVEGGDDWITIECDPARLRPEILAELAAGDYYSGHDGWEVGWPIIITVRADGKELGRFEVELEARPEFYARAVS